MAGDPPRSRRLSAGRVARRRLFDCREDRERRRPAKYYRAIIVRSDGPYQKTADLKGRKFAVGDINATSGSLYPRYVLDRAGFSNFINAQTYVYKGGGVTLAAIINRTVEGIEKEGGPMDQSANQQYDAIVIGAGQAGGPLSTALAGAGRRTALIEALYVGGSCINYGCTPTKTMVACARIAYLARRAADYGVQVGSVSVDMQRRSEDDDRALDVGVQRTDDLVGARRGHRKHHDVYISRPRMRMNGTARGA